MHVYACVCVRVLWYRKGLEIILFRGTGNESWKSLFTRVEMSLRLYYILSGFDYVLCDEGGGLLFLWLYCRCVVFSSTVSGEHCTTYVGGVL